MLLYEKKILLPPPKKKEFVQFLLCRHNVNFSKNYSTNSLLLSVILTGHKLWLWSGTSKGKEIWILNSIS